MSDAPGGVVAAQPPLAVPAPGTGLRARRPLLALASDERLARRAQRGDPLAFDLIFRRYQGELYRFCVGILREPQDAQDALQNAMVKAMRALPGEQREIQLRPWLYRIAHNEAVELHRRRRPTDSLETALVDSGPGPEERAERDQRLQKLFEDIGDLPVRQRSALVMRELSGLEFGEIGAVLGTSAGAVRQALYEARRGLHQMKAGREMACATITRMLSEGDHRRVGRRQLRAHLRECGECRRFQQEIRQRRQAVAAISPLPIAVAYGLLKGMIAVKSTSLTGVAKCVAGVLAVAAIGTAADRAGLAHLPAGLWQGQAGAGKVARTAAPQGGTSEGSEVRPRLAIRRAADFLHAPDPASATSARRLGDAAGIPTRSRQPTRAPAPALSPEAGAAPVPSQGGDVADEPAEGAAEPAESEFRVRSSGEPEDAAGEVAGRPEHPVHPEPRAKTAETSPPEEPAPAGETQDPAPATAETQPEKGKASAPGQIKKQLSGLVPNPDNDGVFSVQVPEGAPKGRSTDG